MWDWSSGRCAGVMEGPPFLPHTSQLDSELLHSGLMSDLVDPHLTTEGRCHGVLCWHMILQRNQDAAAREMHQVFTDLDLDQDPMEIGAVAADGGDRGAPAAGGTGRQGPAPADLDLDPDPSASCRRGWVLRDAALGLLGCIALDMEDSVIQGVNQGVCHKPRVS